MSPRLTNLNGETLRPVLIREQEFYRFFPRADQKFLALWVCRDADSSEVNSPHRWQAQDAIDQRQRISQQSFVVANFPIRPNVRGVLSSRQVIYYERVWQHQVIFWHLFPFSGLNDEATCIMCYLKSEVIYFST